jgi:hypothetical protein
VDLQDRDRAVSLVEDGNGREPGARRSLLVSRQSREEKP